jgi:uroporphyrin-III C-methyltransferase
MDEGWDMLEGRASAPRSRARRMASHGFPRDAHGSVGSVALVGAGPGDPELLTLKAVRLIEAADAIVHDRLVSTSILALAPRARKFYVGKARDRHALAQRDINALLVRLAGDGLRVVRLKGGDPFIFGRGGEELEALAASGIPCDVVPGISAANGIAASAGIPLTHRDHAQTCVFVTGHLKDGTMDLDWAALARPRQTLVVYMGLAALPTLCAELVRHGLAPATPAAVVENGTTPRQRVVAGTLSTLPQRAIAADVASPTLIIVGNVVAFRERLRAYMPAADPAFVSSALVSVSVEPSGDGATVNP